MPEHVRFEARQDGVVIVTLANPPLNIYDLQMRDELIMAFDAIRELPEAKVMLLAADGRDFSAGADLKEFGSARDLMTARRIRWARDPWMALWELPQPTVAALHGYALGAGFEMALLCDIRVAGPETLLSLPEMKLGMLPAAGGTQSLARVVGAAAAAPLVMLGETIDGEEARRRGIVDIVADDVNGEALRIARRMALAPPAALRAGRKAIRIATDLALEDGLRQERLLAAVAWGNEVRVA